MEIQQIHHQRCHCYATWPDNNCYWNDWSHIYSSKRTKKAQVLYSFLISNTETSSPRIPLHVQTVTAFSFILSPKLSPSDRWSASLASGAASLSHAVLLSRNFTWRGAASAEDAAYLKRTHATRVFLVENSQRASCCVKSPSDYLSKFLSPEFMDHIQLHHAPSKATQTQF